MPVTALLDSMTAHLGGVLGAGTQVGVSRPAVAADLPAVALSLPQVDPSLPSLGGRPSSTRTGALPVLRQLDLADPVLVVGLERVALLSADRRTLQLPHGPVVRADGSDVGPFSSADLTVRRGGTLFEPVAGTPGPGELRLDPATGEVVLGAPLPGTGVLELAYFVGQWEMRAERYGGALLVESFASSAAGVQTMSAAIVDALRQPVGGIAGLHRLDPAAVGPIAPATLADARVRSLSYRFDFEHEDPVLPTGGGPIQRVDVVVEQARQAAPQGPPEIDPNGHETFVVRREGS